MSVCPSVVGAFKWLAAPERGGCFEGLGVIVFGVRGCEKLLKLVEVDVDLRAVELVALAVVDPGVSECAPCVGDGLPEAGAGALGVLRGP
jgi:hypothetical protein